MISVHIALYKFKDGVTNTQIDDALLAIEALADKVPGIIEISATANTSKYSEGYTHVIMVRGEDQASIDACRAHPDHTIVAAQLDAMEQHGIGVDFQTN